MGRIKGWLFVVGTVIGILISLLMRDKSTRDDEIGGGEAREAQATEEKEEIHEEATNRRVRAVAAREQLRKRSPDSKRAELLRRARGSKRRGG